MTINNEGQTTDVNVPKKKKHIFRWVFLGVQALFLVWIIGGASSAGTNTERMT